MIVLQTSTQMVKSEFILNCIGFVMDVDPGSVLVIQPREIDAETFARERLLPMLRDCPTLKEKSAYTTNTDLLLHRRFPGGYIALVAAGSAANLKARPVRYLLADEIDSFPYSASGEGDPIDLAVRRVATYPDSKIVLASSPTIDGESRIAKAFAESDQRKYLVPCPGCGLFQPLVWSQVKFAEHGSDRERSHTALYECEHCRARWNDRERRAAVESGSWEPTAPFHGTRGFHLNELASPWRNLSSIVLDFLEKKRRGPHSLQTFINTVLAEVWTAQGERPESSELYERRESYPIGTVPRGPLFLTAGVDVQVDRLEYEIVGWGRNRESWSVIYDSIPGNPADRSPTGPWTALDAVLKKRWPVESGGWMEILSMGIDSGNQPTPIYDFCRRHHQPVSSAAGVRCGSYGTVFALKGTPSADKLISNRSDVDIARRERGGVIVYSVGTHFAKEDLYATLKLFPGSIGYAHFPSYDANYFRSLTSEIRVVRQSGVVEWVKTATRNEALDARIYAMAAAEVAGMSKLRESDWVGLEARIRDSAHDIGSTSVLPDGGPTAASASTPLARPSRPVRAGFRL
jgi:phage terminase large subunit GpA-like protein